METQNQIIHAAHTGKKRIDHFLAELFPDYSRAYFQKLIRKGKVRVRGDICCSSKKVMGGDEVSVDFLDEYAGLEPDASIRLNIIHEDEAVIIINKPAGLVVHPAIGNPRGTLANALAAHLKNFTETLRPGIVHRLDKNTSGIMIIAKTPQAHMVIAKQFADHTVRKSYLAIVHGVPDHRESIIDLPIGRDAVHRQKMAVVSGGRKAETHVKTLETGGGAFSLLEVRPQTGRTHQIRVHLGFIGHPVVGDATYGAGLTDQGDGTLQAERHMLHAWKIAFMHPLLKKEVHYTAPPPEDFSRTWMAITGGTSDVL